MTLPRLLALQRRWKSTPPLVVSLARVTSWLGFKLEAPESAPRSARDVAEKAMSVGLPVASELPPDHMMELFDAPLGTALDGRTIEEVLNGG